MEDNKAVEQSSYAIFGLGIAGSLGAAQSEALAGGALSPAPAPLHWDKPKPNPRVTTPGARHTALALKPPPGEVGRGCTGTDPRVRAAGGRLCVI